MVANVIQTASWFQGELEPGKEIVITALPLYHIYALTVNCFSFLLHGGTNYLITDPRNLNTFIKELKRVPFTSITGVNTLFNGLLQKPELKSVDFSTLRYSSGGGMAVQKAVADAWQETTGTIISEGYGLTEASPVVCINPFDVTEFSGCIGLPVPSTECYIAAEDGSPLPVGEPGELMVRGPQVMQGYWNRPEDTANTITPDGWLKTGDVALMRADGFIRIVDRKKDMILVSGFNVYPNEIEAVVVTHPGVSEVAAIGIPDAKTGEAVKIVVVANDSGCTADDLIHHCREYLTGYKIPRHIEFAPELPKSNVGKILRREVRRQFGEVK
jgi:long-chain acyl-CoA synthetase